MQAENVELMRRIADAANNRDPSLLDELLAPGICWNVRENAPDLVGTYHGIAEVRGFFARWEQAWEEWAWDYPEMRAIGDTVLARMHLWGRGRSSGVQSEGDVWQLWTFRGGKVIYYEDFPTRDEALAAAGALTEAASQDGLGIVRRLYDAWEAGNFAAGLDDLDPHVTFVVRQPFPEPAVLVGPEAISDYMLEFLQQFEPGSHLVRADRLRAVGDTVIADVTQRGVGRSSGVTGELRFCMLFTFRGRKLLRMESVLDEDEALQAIGMPG